MAYYINDEEENLDQNAAPSAPQPSGGSGVIAGQGAAPGIGPSKSPDKPGNFVGIKQYLDANKTQSTKLGDQVSGNIQSAVQGATEEVGSLGDKFKQQVDSGSIKNVSTAQTDAQNIVNAAATGSTPLVQDQTDRFKEVSNAEYKGPKTLIDSDLYQPAYQKLTQVQNYADLSKTEDGNKQLLKQMFHDPSYTAGANRFDSYLLGEEGNKEKLKASRASVPKLTDDFATAEGNANTYSKTVADQTTAARDDARQNLTQTQTQRNAQVESELNSISDNWRSDYDKYLNLLKNSNGGTNLQLNAEEAQRLGVDKGQRIYNILNPALGKTPEQYLSLEAYDPNKVITKEQQMQLAALDELANQFGGPLANKYTMADLAGTLTSEQAFSSDKFGQAADEAQATYDTRPAQVLDNTYLFNPNAAGGYASMIPWNRVDAAHQGTGKFLNASPEELESYWYPLMNQLANETGYASERHNADAIMKSVNRYRDVYGDSRNDVKWTDSILNQLKAQKG